LKVTPLAPSSSNWRKKECSALVNIIPSIYTPQNMMFGSLSVSLALTHLIVLAAIFSLFPTTEEGQGADVSVITLFARIYCAAAIVDRPGHAGGSACLRGGDGGAFWA